MIQKSNFAERVPQRAVWFSKRVSNSFTISFLLAFVSMPGLAIAQNQFSPAPPGNGSSYGQWSPPNNLPPAVNQATNQQPTFQPAPSVSFPESAIAFDPGVRSANLELSASENGNGVSVESTIESTTSMLSNLKSATGQQLSGLVGAMQQDGGWYSKIQSMFGQSDIARMLGSLSLVLGIYFTFVWVMRKISPASNRGLPPEVIEVMGQVPFGARRNLQIVRLGSKLLLLMNSPEGTQPIGEITDPAEVEYLASLCPRKRKSNRSTGSVSVTAIQRAAKRMVNATPEPVPTPTPTEAPVPPQPTNNSNLAQILRTLEQAVKQGGTVFEA